ncbi:MAG: DUF819 family protein [Bacteroidetes bacterium]|nr:DUF819 family protein [Bacteroidota bacterium]
MIFNILQALLILVMPWLLTRLTERLGTQNWLSPVVLCYLFGIGLRNLTTFPVDNGVCEGFVQGTIILALPLLLFSTDLLGWLKLAKSTIIGFVLQIVAVIVCGVFVTWLYRDTLPNGWALNGMLTGVFIGGTPNMNAIAIALEAGEDTFILLNAAEIACGGLYLIFLTSVAHRVFGWFLPEFQGDKHAGVEELLPVNGFSRNDLLTGIGLSLLLAAVAVCLVWLFTGSLQKPGLIILLISALGVGASFSPKIRNLGGTYESGEYLLLMFSIAIGMMADFSEILKSGGTILGYCALVLTLLVVLHLTLCRIFGIDRDTMIITSTAGVFGPAFIGQVAAVIKNRSLLFSGVLTGLVGIAVANFLGILVANLVRGWLF